MSETQVEDREESFAETQAAMYEAVKQAKMYVAAYKNKIDKKLFKEIAAIPVEPPRWYGFWFMHPDLCIGLSTPFRLRPSWRYLIKIGAKYGFFLFQIGWFRFSVRW